MTQFKCPKCSGSDYFMSTRNVMKGVGGIYGNRGGTKKFPVCRNCDEIMDRVKGFSTLEDQLENTRNNRKLLTFLGLALFFVIFGYVIAMPILSALGLVFAVVLYVLIFRFKRVGRVE